RGEKRLEKAGKNLRRNAAAVVAHSDAHGILPAVELCCDPQIPALRHCVESVHHQNKQHLLDLRAVANDERKLRLQFRLNMDSGEVELVLDQSQRAVDHLVYVSSLQIHRRSTGESQKILDQISAAPALARNQFERVANVLPAV